MHQYAFIEKYRQCARIFKIP